MPVKRLRNFLGQDTPSVHTVNIVLLLLLSLNQQNITKPNSSEACTSAQISECEDKEVCLSYDVAASADIEIHPDKDAEGGGIHQLSISQEGRFLTFF